MVCNTVLHQSCTTTQRKCRQELKAFITVAQIWENNGKIPSFLKKMTTTNGFFQEMLPFFGKMMTSNDVSDPIIDVDDDDDQS